MSSSRTHRRQKADRQVSTASSLRVRVERWVVIAVSVAGMVAAAATLVLIWTATAGTPLPERVNKSMTQASNLVLLGVVFLVAWRAGDHPPNVSMALALAFLFFLLLPFYFFLLTSSS